MNEDTFQAMYQSMMETVGEEMILRRPSESGNTDYTVRGKVFDYTVSSDSQQLNQTRRKVVLDSYSITSSGFPLPIVPKADRLLIGGSNFAIVAVDSTARSVRGFSVAFELEVSGA